MCVREMNKQAILESNPSNTAVGSHGLQGSAFDGKGAGLSGGCEVRPWPCQEGGRPDQLFLLHDLQHSLP